VFKKSAAQDDAGTWREFAEQLQAEEIGASQSVKDAFLGVL